MRIDDLLVVLLALRRLGRGRGLEKAATGSGRALASASKRPERQLKVQFFFCPYFLIGFVVCGLLCFI